MSAGAQAYLAKPCELQELRQTIRCLIAGAGARGGALQRRGERARMEARKTTSWEEASRRFHHRGHRKETQS